MSDEIQLGYEVEHRINETKGIVVAVANHVSGCRRIGIIDEDSKSDESLYFYESEVNVVEEETEFTDEAEKALGLDDIEIEVGDVVLDTLSNIEGYATTITSQLHNCPQIGIQPVDETDTTETLDKEFRDEPFVEKIGDGIDEKDVERLAESSEAESGSTGGDIGQTSDIGQIR